MDIITTSLEALIQRATCNQNQCLDTAAIDAFCGLVCKEPDCAQTATRFIIAKVHSLQEWEALQALNVLDCCMKQCGSKFHAEVGKFRFLNELIKLVSPKYNGVHTPELVKRRILELLQSWTVFYPRESKIKEAYDMLKKQGVVKEDPVTPLTVTPHNSLDKNIQPSRPHNSLVKNIQPSRPHNSIFHDTEKSRLLQKLLQSKNPDDLQAANRLIKTMVKEDERRVEMKSRHLYDLEAAHNNARLLGEMLSSYSRETSSLQDLELITELHNTCMQYQPNIQKLLSEVHSDERLFDEVLTANDELSGVLDKYSAVIVQGVSGSSVNGSNLLDLSTPSEDAPTLNAVPLLTDHLTTLGVNASLVSGTGELALSLPTIPPQPMSDLADLGDIFSTVSQTAPPVMLHIKGLVEQPPLRTGLEELDALSESLLRQSLPRTTSQQPPLNLGKVPMNLLPPSPAHSLKTLEPPTSLNLLTASVKDPLSVSDILTENNGKTEEKKTEEQLDNLVAKPLGDIFVLLDCIKPGNVPPLIVLEERDITVTIHFGKESPRPDVSIFVVTTTSKSKYAIQGYLFQAIVPKCCRLRLQPPSSTELPPYNPFLPPAAITQVMLISSLNKVPILLKVVISFTIDDETITEMKELEEFPLLNS